MNLFRAWLSLRRLKQIEDAHRAFQSGASRCQKRKRNVKLCALQAGHQGRCLDALALTEVVARQNR